METRPINIDDSHWFCPFDHKIALHKQDFYPQAHYTSRRPKKPKE